MKFEKDYRKLYRCCRERFSEGGLRSQKRLEIINDLLNDEREFNSGEVTVSGRCGPSLDFIFQFSNRLMNKQLGE